MNAVNSTGYLNTTDYQLIGALVYKQCDALDGVEDGIITNPSACKPDLQQLSCDAPGANSSSCLNAEQIVTMYRIWADYHKETTGEWVFPGFEHGAEGLKGFSVTGSPYGPGCVETLSPFLPLASSLTPSSRPARRPDFFEYQVLNKTEVGAFSANATEMDRLVDIADATDPGASPPPLALPETSLTFPPLAGLTNAINPNISSFLKHGKLLTYVGTSSRSLALEPRRAALADL